MKLFAKIFGTGLCCLVPFLLAYTCSTANQTPPSDGASHEPKDGDVPEETCTPLHGTADAGASLETRILYDRLYALQEKGTMFGAQMPTIHVISDGKPWYSSTDTDRSDTKDVAGSHPAVYGWEIGGIELRGPENLDGDSFDAIRRHMAAAFGRGGISTVSWHCSNPVTDGRYNETSERPIREILPGGSCHAKFIGWLDALASFLGSVKTESGEPVPVIFRPWHEHTDTGKGSGFWWSVGNNSREDFIALWHMTFRYLTEEKGLHNLLWAYSPDLHHLCWDREGIDKYMYMDAWPGDGYVDILGLDAYETPWSNFRTKASEIVAYSCQLAAEKGKPFAITETGFANNSPEHQKYGTDPKWWTERLYPLVSGRKVSYALIWRDDAYPAPGEAYPEYYGGFIGSWSCSDFVDFVSKPDILLNADIVKK